MAKVYEPSDDSEGPVWRDSVNSTLAAEPPPSPSDSRGPSSKYRRQRELVYSEISPRDLLHLLINCEYESSKLRNALQSTQRRAEEAERQLATYGDRFRSLDEDREGAEKKLHNLEEELTSYKIQYDSTQKEIAKVMEEVMRLHAQVERARQDAMKAKEELEVWKMRDKERRLGLEAWWTRAREELDIFVADVSQSEHQETVNEEQPLVREEDETLSFRPFHPLSGSLQFPASREESVRRVRSFSTPHSRPTMSPPAVQTYGVELLPADPVEIDGRASVPNSEALSTVGDTFLSKLATRRGGGEYSKAFSMAGSGSITGGGGAEHSGSTLGDVEWSGFHTYTIGTPPAEQIRFDHRPPEPVRRRSSFHGRSGTKTPPPQLAPPPPPPRQAHPSPLIQRTRPSNSFIPAAKSEDGDIALPPSLQHNIGKRLPPRPQQGVGGENRRKEHTSAKGKERDMGPRYNQQGVILPPNNGVGVGFESSDPPLGSYFQPGEREDSRRNSGSYSIVSVQPLVDAWGVPIQMKDPKTQKLGGWRNMFMSKTTAVGGGGKGLISRNKSIG